MTEWSIVGGAETLVPAESRSFAPTHLWGRLWRLERGTERRAIVVAADEEQLRHDESSGKLCLESAEALASDGRSAVETVLDDGVPPRALVLETSLIRRVDHELKGG